jgi:hypothetical protein
MPSPLESESSGKRAKLHYELFMTFSDVGGVFAGRNVARNIFTIDPGDGALAVPDEPPSEPGSSLGKIPMVSQ